MPNLPNKANGKAADAIEFVESAAPECNWGDLTQTAILTLDFDQGGHSSDPSGDGLGRDGVEDRVGLANVVEQGNLEATCEFIESLLFA